MNQCEQTRCLITFYLDDELQGAERSAVESHLCACEGCRKLCHSERFFLEAIRDARPLRQAAPELRARIERTLCAAPAAPAAPPALRQRVRRTLRRAGLRASGLVSTRRIITLVVLGLFLGLAAFWAVSRYRSRYRRNAPSNFAKTAVDTHLRHLRGQLPLEIASDAPEQISGWFAGKVPFTLQLPNYQESSGQEKLYDLEGARLVGYNSDYAAYVAYRMQNRPISLLVTSEGVGQPSGGEEIISKGIDFHYDSIQGLKVITWADRGLAYALVSDLEERGQQSCIVCHQGTKDRNFIEGLELK